MVIKKVHRISRFCKHLGDKDFGSGQFTFKKGVSDFLLYLKSSIDFLDFGKMGATRILEIDILHLEMGDSDFLSYLKRCIDSLDFNKWGRQGF